MGILMDIILVAILILNVMLGYKRGLVNAIFSIFAFLVAIIITLILYKPVSSIIINNTEVVSKIENVIVKNNNEEESKEVSDDDLSLQKYVNDVTQDAKEHSMEVVAETVASKAVEVITGIVLFIIVRIVLILLKFVTESIAELPIIKQFNQVGGIVYGIIKACIIIYIILTILFIVVSINGSGIISQGIENSFITKVLYENNVIVKYCLLGKNLL